MNNNLTRPMPAATLLAEADTILDQPGTFDDAVDRLVELVTAVHGDVDDLDIPGLAADVIDCYSDREGWVVVVGVDFWEFVEDARRSAP
ncbi:hypothetical protein GII30_21240 [Gordonia amarae]|mgnify:CR=1 FL=1|uniref:Uncharacterized protein n=2 Tax=Gordonia amarae TaxID=36821 RepID=G7GWA5_9ACTN|nr:hypothetical protein [Gordonia amarae]MCS3880972.1 hypothetical protein [Gordonia amarae]QHN19213.1 hypothetical protein GII35_21535 [Gordonia amarae]QHN23689.1 hypothetical protein GII34_21035 [Gordonia amarae]QHN32601.1 hypothetical protein GII32_21365 [Gordonia amarae]QHN41349.1 hypothetical protein GII30_21240 [Gordonia amarae]